MERVGGSWAWLHAGKRRALSLLVFCSPALGACDSLGDLLEVKASSQLPAEGVEVPANASALVDGAVANFECALANYVLAGGEIGDELKTMSLGAVRWGYDRRSYEPSDAAYAAFPCEGGPGSQGAISVYRPIQIARGSADRVLSLLQTSWTAEDVPSRESLIGRAAGFSGYSHLLLGEGFCSAAVDGGPELTRTEIFELAIHRFDVAIQVASTIGAADVLNLARVGRARALVNTGDFTAALADAQAVPPGFVYNARYSAAAGRTENRIYSENVRSFNTSVDHRYLDVTFEGVPDPRVPVASSGVIGPNRSDTVLIQRLYTTESSPIPIATWEEAQLIVAEAKLEAGSAREAVDAINLLHTAAGLPPYSGGNAAEIRGHLIEERRRQLFLQGDRKSVV